MNRENAGSNRANRKKRSAWLLFLAGVVVGLYLAFNLPEKKRIRVAGLLSEAKEMPFRLFI